LIGRGNVVGERDGRLEGTIVGSVEGDKYGMSDGNGEDSMLGNGPMLESVLDGIPVGERSVSSTSPGLVVVGGGVVVGEKDSIGTSVVPGLVSTTVGEFVSDIGAMTGLLVIEGAASDGPIAPPGFPAAYRNKDKSDSY
jgi:hypothetical protein